MNQQSQDLYRSKVQALEFMLNDLSENIDSIANPSWGTYAEMDIIYAVITEAYNAIYGN